MLTYIQAESISKAYGDLLLFEKLTFCIREGQKSALIARNGAGKTSLLQILAGKQEPDTGTLLRLKDISIGYLPQDPLFDPEETVLQAMWSHAGEMVHKVLEYEEALLSGDKIRLAASMGEMDRLQAWDFESKIKQILTQLNIHNLDQKMGSLSGGQRKRVALATVLIQNHDLLILDEPTNHLDVDMIEWLEEFLRKTRSALFMVTHDRYFLESLCNEIFELDLHEMIRYQGNYSHYLEKRQERINRIEAETGKARNLLKNELEWMRRMPQARATKAKHRIRAFYELKEKAARRPEERDVALKTGASRLGSKIIECRHVSKSFENKSLIRDFTHLFSRNEKVGIIGPNGTGKTTFLNLLSGKILPDEGTIERGITLATGYYEQNGIEIKPGQRVIDVVKEMAEVITLGDGKVMSASQFLNLFLFPPDMQYTPVEKLSGGERRRLYLLTVLIRNPNFLMLDEPTNDLDISTLQVLEEYLINFNGCLVIVSHDRYFMDKLTDHLFVFDGSGSVKDFPGNYTDYRNYTLQEASEKTREEKIREKPMITGSSTVSSRKKLSWKEQKELEDLEQEISAMEDKKQRLETEISSGSLSQQALIEKSETLGEMLSLLDQKMERWLELESLQESYNA